MILCIWLVFVEWSMLISCPVQGYTYFGCFPSSGLGNV